MTAPADPQDAQCPFCNECGFDLIGLKNHYKMGWCEIYNTTTEIVPYPVPGAKRYSETTP